MNDEQRYLFDSRGVFTLPGALSLSHVDELNRIFDEVEESDSPSLGGPGHMGGDALHWGKAYRDLLDMPQISPILEELVGNHRPSDQDIPSFRVDHVNVHNRCKGADNRYFDGYFQGHNLHGGGLGNSGSLGGGGSQFYRYQDGHFFNGLTVVTYELKDTHANGGGFCCVPGSHNGHLKLPEEWGDMSSPINIDAEWLYKVPASAGDAVIFTEALTHGAIPWTQEDSSRRTLFYKYSPHGTSWSSQYYNEEDYYQYEDMDDRKFAILKAPSAHMWTPPKIGRANSKVTTTRDGVGEMQRGKASASL